MKRTRAIWIAFVLMILCADTAWAAGAVPKKVLTAAGSVVSVAAEYEEGFASGSGFVIYNDSDLTLVATNDHVVEGAPRHIWVWINDDEKILATVHERNVQKDLCILALTLPADMPALTLREDAVRQGDAVYAVGFPAAADTLSNTAAHMSSAATITDGIVSAVRQTTVVEYGAALELLQMNAAINAGNSGGPLFNPDGEVVGINTYGTFDSQGIFGAISSRELIHFMQECDIPVQRTQAGMPAPVWYVSAGISAILSGVVILLLLRWHGDKRGKKSSAPMLFRAMMKERGQGMKEEEAVSLLMPAALALRQLHDEGRTHLEISPDRIEVTGGKAHLLPSTGEEADRYTNGFTPPEIYRGTDCGARSDIYSFCAVLQYAVTGMQPENALSRGEDEAGTDFDIAHTEGGSVEVAAAHMPAILAKGMRLDAGARYSNMQAMLDDLAPLHMELVSVNAAVPSMEGAGTKKRIKSAALIVPACILALMLLTAGAYFGCYWRAVSLAEGGSFSQAQKYILAERITAQHDPYFLRYIEAGILFENRQYGDARTSFRELNDYRSAGAMTDEATYRYAAQLADRGEFSQSIFLYDSLGKLNYKKSKQLWSDTRYRRAVYWLYEDKAYGKAYSAFQELYEEGYVKAGEMCNETTYRYAWDLYDSKEYVDAYNQFTSIRGYDNVNEILSTLTDTIYVEAQLCYYEEYYYLAHAYFECIAEYKDSNKYLVLTNARTANTIADPQAVVDDLLAIFDFEDAADVLMSRLSIAKVFLAGTWSSSNNKYYMSVDIAEGFYYNLPDVAYGEYYSIEDGKMILYLDQVEVTGRLQFSFYLMSPKSMKVYCAKNGETYTLYRR